jgi:hypothetical protein
VLVEAALILPVLILIVVGIIEFGLLFTSYSTANGSTRSGGRLAATAYSQAGTSSTAQDDAAEQIALAAAADLEVLNNAVPVGMAIYRVNPSSNDGAPVGGFPGDNMSGGCTANCIRYTWNEASGTMVRTSGSWPNPDACGVDVDSVGVFVQVKHSYILNLFGRDHYADAHTVMRLEPLPADQCG